MNRTWPARASGTPSLGIERVRFAKLSLSGRTRRGVADAWYARAAGACARRDGPLLVEIEAELGAIAQHAQHAQQIDEAE